MIFVINTSNQADNESLLKQAKDLTQKKYTFFERTAFNKSLQDSKRGLIYTSADKNKPITQLKPNETLYVVGHGDREHPQLSGLSAQELASVLLQHGLNPRIKGLKINLVCCHSGHKPSINTPSFAELFYSALLSDIHEIDRHHMQKSGGGLTVKAPKHVIGFRYSDGKAVGLQPKDYDGYNLTQQKNAAKLDDWLNEHVTELTEADFQLL